jgi:hypothetical protein
MDETPVSSVRRWQPVLVLLAGCLLLTGCQAPPPDVTFYGNRSAVETGPTTICAVDNVQAVIDCPDTAVDSFPRLTLRRGDSLQINVPAEVGHSPWTVDYTYLDKDGVQCMSKPLAFVDGQLAFTLRPPTAQDQLLTVNVRDRFLPVMEDDGTEAVQPTRAWQLQVDPATPAPADSSAECAESDTK